jgi:hypothetical protein
MKKILYFFILAISLISCKKYPNDKFLSSFSPEKRLIKGDSCIWYCNKYVSSEGIEHSFPVGYYGLEFNKSSVICSFFNQLELEHDWSLENSKEVLNISGVEQLKINSLTIDKLELENSSGEKYYFQKEKKSIPSEFNTNILQVPLFGLTDKRIKMFDYNNCEELNISASFSNSSGTNYSPILMEGWLNNGIGYGYYSYTACSFKFSKNFSKTGFISFMGFMSCNMDNYPSFKINNISEPYQVKRLYTNSCSNWDLFTIDNIPTGFNQFEIKGGYYTSISTLDEVYFWEYVE